MYSSGMLVEDAAYAGIEASIGYACRLVLHIRLLDVHLLDSILESTMQCFWWQALSTSPCSCYGASATNI